jgi:predicted glycosyltransferase
MSLLPHDKDTIKEAIKVELMYAGTAEPQDEKMIRTLKLAFLQLASFLPDDEVVPEFEVDEALESEDVCHNYYKYLDGSEKVSNHILEQTSILVEELDEFCQDNGL